jgi:hypothetical protein
MEFELLYLTGSVVVLLGVCARKWLRRMPLTENALRGEDDAALEELGPNFPVLQLGLSVLFETLFSFAPKSFGRQPWNTILFSEGEYFISIHKATVEM